MLYTAYTKIFMQVLEFLFALHVYAAVTGARVGMQESVWWIAKINQMSWQAGVEVWELRR